MRTEKARLGRGGGDGNTFHRLPPLLAGTPAPASVPLRPCVSQAAAPERSSCAHPPLPFQGQHRTQPSPLVHPVFMERFAVD